MKMKRCETGKHDYENAVRCGRAFYICPICREDISMEIILLEELKQDSIKINNIK